MEISANDKEARNDETQAEKMEETEDNNENTTLLEDYIKELNDKISYRQENRLQNDREKINYPEESFFIKLDSSVKRNSAFVRKIRNMTEAQKESLFKDITSLNLTKYVSEIASAIVEAKLKLSDIQMATKLCSLLHQRYTDFSSQLLDCWSKSFPKKTPDLANMNASKIRIDLRFFAELIACGVFTQKEGLPVLGNLLTLLTASDKDTHNNLNIILSFCRHCGDEFAGLIPKCVENIANKRNVKIPQSQFLPADRQRGVRNLLKDYYKSLTIHLVKDHKSLQNLEKQNRKLLVCKGELSNERKEKYEQAQIAFQKMLTSSQQLADLLGEDLPDLPNESPDANEDIEENAFSLDVTNRFKNGSEYDNLALWEDEDARNFYESLPDLKAFVPSILYKDSVKDGMKESANKQEVKTNDSDKDADDKLSNENEKQKETVDDEEVLDEDEDALLATLDDDGNVSGTDEESSREVASTQPSETNNKNPLSNQANKVILDAFLTSLQNCVNRDMIDKSALNFCTNLNTKHNRKKLIRALFTVPRTRLDLLPFYARLVATLSPLMPHVASDLVHLLKQDFRFHIRKKDQINIESKIKNVRFIGELVKFNIFPKTEALHCLKLLLLDFSHHQIEMTCNLLETCGRFLFRSMDSHHKCKLLLDQMMRKKALLPYDSKYVTMIENAYYFANTPDTQSISKQKEYTPIQEYIRTLIYKDLNKSNMDKVLRQIRKLNWEKNEISSFVINCFISTWKIKFYNIRCLANLLAGLSSYQEWIVPRVVDGVLEDIRIGLEINHPKFNQRRISMVRYLGEIYNYRLIDSSVVFKVLYTLITYGVFIENEISESNQTMVSEIDPPDNLFRVRLVCQLLDTCGQYFNSGTSKRKLDCFILFFQRYFWFKKSQNIYSEEYPFPILIEYLLRDTIHSLRPKFVLANSYVEACKSVEHLLNELKPKVLELCPNLNLDKQNTNNEMSEIDNSLKVIPEADEADTTEADVDTDAPDDEYYCNDHERKPRKQSEGEDGNDGNRNSGQIVTTTTDEGSESEAEQYDELDENLMTTNIKQINCQEDDEFQKEFEKIMSESIISRTQENVRTTINDIVIPMNKQVKQKTVLFSEERKSDEKNLFTPDIVKCNDEEKVIFKLLTKTKGNKPLLKSVEVPVNSDLALTIKEKEEAERAEKEHVKKLTLDINERRELEDEFTEKLSNSPLVMNLNRDFRKKYCHPKGAPDADLIFGNKRHT